MKIIGILILLFLENSCSSAKVQKASVPSQVEDVKKGIVQQHNRGVSNPNSMELVAVLIDFFEEQREICGISVKKTMKVKVLKVSNEGFGILDIPRLDSVLELSANAVNPPEVANDTLLIKVGDRLCQNGAVFYEVFEYKRFDAY